MSMSDDWNAKVEWLKGLDVGSIVIVETLSHPQRQYRKGMVIRSTKASVWVRIERTGDYNGERFHRKDGNKVGHSHSWRNQNLVKPTAENITLTKRQAAIGDIILATTKPALENLTLESLHEILRIFREGNKP